MALLNSFFLLAIGLSSLYFKSSFSAKIEFCTDYWSTGYTFRLLPIKADCNGSITRILYCPGGSNEKDTFGWWFNSFFIIVTAYPYNEGTICGRDQLTSTNSDESSPPPSASCNRFAFIKDDLLGFQIERSGEYQFRYRCFILNELFIITTNNKSVRCDNEYNHPYVVLQLTQSCTEDGGLANITESDNVLANTGPRNMCNDTDSTSDYTAVIILVVVILLESFACGIAWIICLFCLRKQLKSRSKKYSNEIKGLAELENSLLDTSNRDQQVTTGSYAVIEPHYDYWEPEDTSDAIYLQINQKRYPMIKKNDISLSSRLGEGEFGLVMKGKVRNGEEVAVKALREGAGEEDKSKLLKEAAIMGQFSHPNVIRLIGIAMENEEDNDVKIVMELIVNGDLRSHLLSLPPNIKKTNQQKMTGRLFKFCLQICDAMSYLSQKKFIHRDLAARNVLLDGNWNCKIADFGMSHDMDKDYYYTPKGGLIPIKWTAPEAILYHKYTTKSDVWSFGMVMFEIWSLGHKPFEELTTQQVVQAFQTGYCQPPPPGCPRKIYEVMVDTWNPELHDRKAFPDIYKLLKSLDQQTLAEWSVEDRQTSLQAAILGAPLQEGMRLYPELQNKYIKE